MSMSVLNPRLQVVNRLPDSPKIEAKGVLLVRGPWEEAPAPPGFRLISTGLNLFQVCGRVRPCLIAFFGYLVCDDGLTLGCSCREGLARQAGELGGKVEFRENLPAIRDFRAEVSL